MKTGDNAMRRALAVLLVAAGVGGRGVGEASVLPVPGVYPTIQAAVDAAADFDTVLVAPGVYYEQINIPAKPITLAAQNDDPLTTILDGSPRDGASSQGIISLIDSDRGAQVIRGFTLRNGGMGLNASRTLNGPGALDVVVRNNRFVDNHPHGALYHWGGHLTLVDNHFEGNVLEAGTYRGAVYQLGPALIERNTFVNNGSPGGADYATRGGALHLGEDFVQSEFADVIVRANLFRGNVTPGDGAAIFVVGVDQLEISGNRFEQNRAGGVGGAICVEYGPAGMNGNVFVGNEAARGSAVALTYAGSQSLFQNTIVGGVGPAQGEAVLIQKTTGSVSMDYNIVAFNAGAGVRWVSGLGTLGCNNLYANAGGDLAGTLPFGSFTNFISDPLFCDRAAADLTLAANSPCLPAAHPCDGTVRVGALGEGCAAVAVQAVTWGRLKAMYGGPAAGRPVPTRRP